MGVTGNFRRSVAFASSAFAKASEWWLAVAGSIIGWLIFWLLGPKDMIANILPSDPLAANAAILTCCVLVGIMSVFLLRLLYAPIHFRFEPYGGPRAYLRATLGVHMWPIVLMAAGFFCFVTLSGSGLIWLAVQTARAKPGPNNITATEPVLPPDVGASPELKMRSELFQRTASLPPKDKEELSAALRDLSEKLKIGNALVAEANPLLQEFRNQRASAGSLAKNLPALLAKLVELRKASSDFEKAMFGYFNGQYFDRQMAFVVGPDINKTAILQRGIMQLELQLERWQLIENKQAQGMEYLIDTNVMDFEQAIQKFNQWLSQCAVGFAEIKQIVT
jgi:hypothetical protein